MTDERKTYTVALFRHRDDYEWVARTVVRASTLADAPAEGLLVFQGARIEIDGRYVSAKPGVVTTPLEF